MVSVSKHGSRRRARFSVAIGAVAGLAIVMLVPQNVAAYTITGCKYGSASVGVQQGTMYNSDYATALGRAVNRWNVSSQVNTVLVGNSVLDALTANLGDPNMDGIANWFCPPGLPTTWSIARLNTQTTTGYNTEKKNTVWLHELGHALGLGHVSAGNQVMRECPACAYNLYGIVYPNVDDVNGMNYLY